MFDEYDVVKAKRKLSDKVLENSIGTVVMIFPEFPNDYMVEFMKDEKTLDILVIKEDWKNNKICKHKYSCFFIKNVVFLRQGNLIL